MAGYDPALMAQARAAMGYAPLSGPDMLASQDAAMADQQAVDFAMANGGQPVPAEAVMSVQPPPAPYVPPEENEAALMSEPIMNYPQEAQPSRPTRPVWMTAEQEEAANAAQARHEGEFSSAAKNFGEQLRELGKSGAQWRPEYSGRSDLGLGAMRKEAAQRRAAADSARTSAGIDADMALEGQALSAEQLGAARQRTADATANNRRDAAAIEAQTQGRLDAEYDSHLKATEKVAARKREVDDYIGNYQVKDRRSIDRKAMGALAVFAAGMQDQQNMIAGMSMGQPVVTNRGADMAALIGRQVDRDLEMQREMLSNKRTQAAALGTELGQARERWGDTREALLTAKQLKLDQFEKGLEAIKAQGTSEEASILADQAIEALRMQKAQIDEERARGDYDKAFSDEQRLKQAQFAQQQAAAHARAMTPERALKLEGAALDNAEKRQKIAGGNAPYGLRPLGGGAPSQRATEKAQDLASSFNGLRATISDLRAIAKKGASSSPTERANAREALQSLKSQYNGAFGDGTAPNEAQLKAMDDVFVNPAEVNLADAERVFEHLDKRAVNLSNAKLRGYGYSLDSVDVRPE